MRRAVALSIAVHLLILLIAVLFPAGFGLNKKIHPKRRAILIEVSPVKKQRIVKSSQGEEVEKASDDAYLSDKNRSVKKQTVAKSSGLLRKIGVNYFKNQRKYTVEGGSRPDIAWADQDPEMQSETQDFVEGVAESEYTALNTKEYIYYSYYQRIREHLDRAWRNLLGESLKKLYRKGRFPASEKDHVTRTLVTLNAKGEVVRVQVMAESGVEDLDEVAVRAFNQAGPFPNPPQGMIDPEGRVQVRWDFILRT